CFKTTYPSFASLACHAAHVRFAVTRTSEVGSRQVSVSAKGTLCQARTKLPRLRGHLIHHLGPAVGGLCGRRALLPMVPMHPIPPTYASRSPETAKSEGGKFP